MLQLLLERYSRAAITLAIYEPLEDGSFVGRVPALKGAIAFGADEEQCELDLFSVVEDWARVGMQRVLCLPIVDGTDLNTAEARRLDHY